MYCCDFFKMKVELLEDKCDSVFDRGAFEAIFEADREAYAKLVLSLVKPDFRYILNIYDYEGEGDSIISLSSLESGEDQLDGMDWADTFRAMGPKFNKLADLCDEEEADEEDGLDSADVGGRRKAPNVSEGDSVNIGLAKKVGPNGVKTAPTPAKRNLNGSKTSSSDKLVAVLDSATEV